jgi:hypothetical protein
VARFQWREKTNEIFRKGQAVGVDFAITGTLPTLADVIAFKEGSAEFGAVLRSTHDRLPVPPQGVSDARYSVLGLRAAQRPTEYEMPAMRKHAPMISELNS